MIDMTALVLSLNAKQVLELDDVYMEINLILTVGESSHFRKLQRIKNYLLSKRDSSSGKLKKIYSLMAKSKNIEEGMESYFADKLEATKKKQSQVPQDCIESVQI